MIKNCISVIVGLLRCQNTTPQRPRRFGRGADKIVGLEKMKKYNPNKIERKWQKYWEDKKLYEAKDFSGGKEPRKMTSSSRGNNFMLLVEFPYPSGDLHTGHWFAFSVPDIYGRYLRMNGFNVMYPIGFDAFGLPAENAAIKNNIHPRDWTKKNITKMSKQLRSMGAGFDWSREVSTIDPEYYRWTQWIFIQLYNAGLAYRAETLVNWCPNDKTVLANEQVIDGKCDRCGSAVEQRNLSQWMFKITSFADRLIDDLKDLDWPESTKLAQINWIGKSEGININYDVEGVNIQITVYTTRSDTNFGATFIVVAPDSKFVKENKELFSNEDEVKKYLAESKKKSDLERIAEGRKKTGVFTGLYAVNNLTDKKMPIYISDFVLATVGTGAVVGVPGHDVRDFEFAQEKGLEVIRVVVGKDDDTSPITKIEQVQEGAGIIVNSKFLNGLDIHEATEKIKDYIEEKGWGKRAVNYRLHDWVLSRQRYWGVPIPLVFCEHCAAISNSQFPVFNDKEGGTIMERNGKRYAVVPVPENELPVKLPPLKDFMPADDSRSPLAKAGKWLKVKCPKCGQPAERETDTMDTFVDSSWYYMRYTDPKNEKEFASQENMAKWLPLPLYFGGAEHNTMHLLYSRFITKALRSQNLIDFSEPFLGRRNHGFIMDSTTGQKMSKSKGQAVDPDEQVAKYGADTMRMYFAFMGPYDQNYAWNFDSVLGVRRFLDRVWNFVNKPTTDNQQPTTESPEVRITIHKAIKNVGEAIKSHRFNVGVSELMKCLNAIEHSELSVVGCELFVKLLAPFAPHIAEELWMEVLGNKTSVHLEKWPEFNEALLLEELVTLVIQVNSRVRDTISVRQGLSEDEVKKIVLANEKIQKALEGKEIKKFIYIQDRLTNIVV